MPQKRASPTFQILLLLTRGHILEEGCPLKIAPIQRVFALCPQTEPWRCTWPARELQQKSPACLIKSACISDGWEDKWANTITIFIKMVEM
jgi:hypothetical protein